MIQARRRRWERSLPIADRLPSGYEVSRFNQDPVVLEWGGGDSHNIAYLVKMPAVLKTDAATRWSKDNISEYISLSFDADPGHVRVAGFAPESASATGMRIAASALPLTPGLNVLDVTWDMDQTGQVRVRFYSVPWARNAFVCHVSRVNYLEGNAPFVSDGATRKDMVLRQQQLGATSQRQRAQRPGVTRMSTRR